MRGICSYLYPGVYWNEEKKKKKSVLDTLQTTLMQWDPLKLHPNKARRLQWNRSKSVSYPNWHVGDEALQQSEEIPISNGDVWKKTQEVYRLQRFSSAERASSNRSKAEGVCWDYTLRIQDIVDEMNDSICSHDVRVRDFDGIHKHSVVHLRQTV